MNKEEIRRKIEKVFSKDVKRHKITDFSQMCRMWPMHDPPDTLEHTKPILDLGNEFNFTIFEDEAVEIYDMTAIEAVEYIYQLLIEENKNKSAKNNF